MGYILHEAIIVISWKREAIEAAHAKAVELALPVTDIVLAPWNGYESFAVLPDGSKEGWDEADEFAAKRAALIESMLAVRYHDGSSCLDFCSVRWGEGSDSIAKSRRDLNSDSQAERARAVKA